MVCVCVCFFFQIACTDHSINVCVREKKQLLIIMRKYRKCTETVLINSDCVTYFFVLKSENLKLKRIVYNCLYQ